MVMAALFDHLASKLTRVTKKGPLSSGERLFAVADLQVQATLAE
jgi:hypothetical protein